MQESNHEPAPEALNRLGHLSSGVGHHVINAFSAIVSNAELLRIKFARNSQSMDPAAMADMIINTALEAASVARRLIDYTRPITNIGETKVDLDRLVASYVDSRGGSDPTGLTWATELAPVPPIRGLPVHLESMLDLLVENAKEAMAPGREAAIAISTSIDSRGWVALEVRDNGQGMEPQVQERAVEPFFTTKAGHVGVGLSIANGIWRRHRGTLSIRSQPGEGTALRLCVEPCDE